MCSANFADQAIRPLVCMMFMHHQERMHDARHNPQEAEGNVNERLNRLAAKQDGERWQNERD